MAATPKVSPWYDISFQHSSPGLLRRMRRFGSTEAFLELVDGVRARQPEAGIRSNVIVGFPGETEEDVAELERFLTEARLDVVGVFGYSDEDGTEGEGLSDKVDPDVIEERVERLRALVDELAAQRAEDRVGQRVRVLVESVATDDGDDNGEGGDLLVIGRSDHQGPDVDGETLLVGELDGLVVGDLVDAVVEATEGIDLVARVTR